MTDDTKRNRRRQNIEREQERKRDEADVKDAPTTCRASFVVAGQRFMCLLEKGHSGAHESGWAKEGT